MNALDDDLCLRVLATRLSAHLDMIAGHIYEIEKDLGQVLTGQCMPGEISVTKTQRLDFARQSLEDCALLLHLISSPKTGDFGCVHDAEKIAARLKLETTQGLVRTVEQKHTAENDGEVDFF